MYERPRLDSDIRFEGLSLRRITGNRKLRGRVGGGAEVKGYLPNVKGRVWARVPTLRFGENTYRSAQLEVSLKKGDVLLDYAGVERKGGGRIRAWGAYRKSGEIKLTAQIEKMPLIGIPGLSQVAPKQVSGDLSGSINVTGTTDWPILAGDIKLADAEVRGAYMGTAKIHVEPGARESDISGDLFGHFNVDGKVALQPKPRLALDVSFDRFPIRKVMPEMEQVAGARGFVTGKMGLALTSKGVSSASVRLEELQVTMLSPTLDPTLPPEKITVKNQEPIVVDYNGRRVAIRSFHMAGAGGDFQIGGWASPKDSRLRLGGRIGLKPLELFAPEQLDGLGGSVIADVSIRGPLSKPQVRGRVDLADASVLLAGRESPIVLPSGTVTVRDRGRGWELLAVALEELKIGIGGEMLRADGKLTLAGTTPKKYNLRVSGVVSGEALEVAAPKTVSRARGGAKVDVTISGTAKDQSIEGTATLKRTELYLRGVRRDIVVTAGQLDFDGSRLTVRGFRAKVDEGYVQASGHAILKEQKLTEVDFKIDAQNIPYRKPRVFDVEASADLRLTGDREGITLSGQVNILDGRYVQRFDVVRQAFLKKRVYEGRAETWKDNPWLANLQLNLSVATAGNVFIQNNLADMRLDGSIYVGGRLADPKLAGQIQVDEGTFRIPFMRGTYEVRSGEVDFNRGKEPYLNLVGETTVRDRADNEHVITLTLKGFLSEIRIDLRSDTNLPKSQILLLLTAGRTTDTLRQDFRGRGDTGPGTGRTGSALDVYDPMLKQVSGDFLSDLVAKPIKDITRLDLFRLELGTSAVQLRIEKRLGRYFKLVGETEFGLMGRQRQEGRLQGKFHDNIYLDLKGRRLIPGEDVFEEEDPLQGRIQLRYRLQFKGGLIRSLGF
jgi:hypothetical protein